MSRSPRAFRSTRPADPGRQQQDDARPITSRVLRLTDKCVWLFVYGESERIPRSLVTVSRGQLEVGQEVDVLVQGWKVRQLMKARRARAGA